MELHIPDRTQSRLPCAFLSRTLTISTPYCCFACKNRFLHDVPMHCREAYKICHLKTRELTGSICLADALGIEWAKNFEKQREKGYLNNS